MGQPEPRMVFDHDGVTYTLTPGDFTGIDDLEVYRTTGVTIAQIMFGGKVSLFTVAALLWRYRVGNGEPDLSYRDVASTFTFADIKTVRDDEDEGDTVAPKASVGS